MPSNDGPAATGSSFHPEKFTEHKTKKTPTRDADWGFFLIKCLAVTYSHMGKPHTTIGDETFHF